MLTSFQLRRLTEFTADLHGARDLDQLGRTASEALHALLPGDWPIVGLATSLLPVVRRCYSPHPADWERFAVESRLLAHEDPVYTARLRLLLDGPASAIRMVKRRDLERTDLYNSVWRPLGIRRLVRYLSPSRLSFGVEVARPSSREFTDEEVGIVHAVGRHLNVAAERLAGEHGGRLPGPGGVVPVQRFSWLVCDASGAVLRSPPEARALMRACLGADAPLDRLPGDWLAELNRRRRGAPATPRWYAPNGMSVSVHVAPIRPTASEYSVGFLQHTASPDPVRTLMGLGLTLRQAEVLRWVAEGKTNAEAGIILGISALTVKKHLESVFHTLGVENRTAAVVAAMEAMREGGHG